MKYIASLTFFLLLSFQSLVQASNTYIETQFQNHISLVGVLNYDVADLFDSDYQILAPGSDFYKLLPHYELVYYLPGTALIRKELSVRTNDPKKLSEDGHSSYEGVVIIGVVADHQLIPSAIKIFQRGSGKLIKEAETTASVEGNPLRLGLEPGFYKVSVADKGRWQAHQASFTMEVVEGHTFYQLIEFESSSANGDLRELS